MKNKKNLEWYYKMIIGIIILLIISFFISCDVTKKAFKSKNDIETFETIKTNTFRKGDTVTYIVPNIKYKDTVIKTVSEQGTIIRNYYDSKGEIYKNDCVSAEINQLREELRKTTDQSKNKQSEKTEKFDSSFILYIVGGAVVLGIFALVLMFVFINKNTKAVTSILNNLPK